MATRVTYTRQELLNLTKSAGSFLTDEEQKRFNLIEGDAAPVSSASTGAPPAHSSHGSACGKNGLASGSSGGASSAGARLGQYSHGPLRGAPGHGSADDRFSRPTGDRSWRGGRDKETFEEGYLYELEQTARHRQMLQDAVEKEHEKSRAKPAPANTTAATATNTTGTSGSNAAGGSTSSGTPSNDLERLLTEIAVKEEMKTERKSRFFSGAEGGTSAPVSKAPPAVSAATPKSLDLMEIAPSHTVVWNRASTTAPPPAVGASGSGGGNKNLPQPASAAGASHVDPLATGAAAMSSNRGTGPSGNPGIQPSTGSLLAAQYGGLSTAAGKGSASTLGPTLQPFSTAPTSQPLAASPSISNQSLQQQHQNLFKSLPMAQVAPFSSSTLSFPSGPSDGSGSVGVSTAGRPGQPGMTSTEAAGSEPQRKIWSAMDLERELKLRDPSGAWAAGSKPAQKLAIDASVLENDLLREARQQQMMGQQILGQPPQQQHQQHPHQHMHPAVPLPSTQTQKQVPLGQQHAHQHPLSHPHQSQQQQQQQQVQHLQHLAMQLQIPQQQQGQPPTRPQPQPQQQQQQQQVFSQFSPISSGGATGQSAASPSNGPAGASMSSLASGMGVPMTLSPSIQPSKKSLHPPQQHQPQAQGSVPPPPAQSQSQAPLQGQSQSQPQPQPQPQQQPQSFQGVIPRSPPQMGQMQWAGTAQGAMTMAGQSMQHLGMPLAMPTATGNRTPPQGHLQPANLASQSGMPMFINQGQTQFFAQRHQGQATGHLVAQQAHAPAGHQPQNLAAPQYLTASGILPGQQQVMMFSNGFGTNQSVMYPTRRV